MYMDNALNGDETALRALIKKAYHVGQLDCTDEMAGEEM